MIGKIYRILSGILSRINGKDSGTKDSAELIVLKVEQQRLLKATTKLVSTVHIQVEKLQSDIQNSQLIASMFLTVPDDEMYGRVLEIILSMLDSIHGVFGYLDKDGALVCPSMTREIWKQCQMSDKVKIFPRKEWGNSIWGRSMSERQTLLSNTPLSAPEGHIPIQRVLCAPIVYDEESIGVLEVANKEVDYTPKDIGVLEGLAEYVAPILHSRLQRNGILRELK